MKNHTPTSGHGAPDAFLSKFGEHITGVLSGFDRLRFRGTLRVLFDPSVMEVYLLRWNVLIKQFKTFAESITGRVRRRMRGRVNLKSPVRENCPPGSVRGAPGNWCPYLDSDRIAVRRFR